MKEELLKKIEGAGVVGAGGAGFPTHVKLRCTPDTVIANCAECEPVIKSDKYLMEQNAEEIVEGMEAVLACTGAVKGVLAVKQKNKEAVRRLEEAIAGKEKLSLHLLDNYYPAGDEQQIIYEITGRVVPVGELPIKVGCVVVNAQTLFHISQAVKGIPVTRRMVTVAGEVKAPMAAEVPVGTPVHYLLELAGGAVVPDYTVILGGPLMGRVSEDPKSEFVTKTTNGIIVLPSSHPLVEKKTDDFNHQLKIAKSACCQCNYCTLICPRSNLGLGVSPHKIMQALTLNNASILADGQAALGCCNCGLCTYVGCNMNLSPNRFIAEVRAQLLAKKVKSNQEPGTVNLFRNESKVPSKRVIQRMGLTPYDIDIRHIDTIQMPKAVRILLRQHIGAPCIPSVKEGDIVEAGQCVGRIPEKALGARVHASIRGRVVSVNSEYVDIMKV
ncbi:MAG: SLBB domain-containing protein [Lachnospiraceae bacterium]